MNYGNDNIKKYFLKWIQLPNISEDRKMTANYREQIKNSASHLSVINHRRVLITINYVWMLGQCSELRLVLPPLPVLHRTLSGSCSIMFLCSENKEHEKHGDDHNLPAENYIHYYFPCIFFFCRNWSVIHGYHANNNKIWVETMLTS